jgi:Ca2+-binding EF-hand superfamily protein
LFTIFCSHPFDRCAELDDDAIQQVILKVAPDQENHMQVLNEIVFDDRVEGLSHSCIELMRLLIHPDPQKRINSEQYLRHPWIQGLTAPWTMMGKAHMELKAFWQNKFRTEIIQKFADSLGISQEELSDRHVEEIFHNLDIKKNGVLEPDEIQTTFRELGISEKNIQSIFAAIDLDGSGVIRFDEFRALLLDKGTSDLHVNYLQKRFKSHILNRFVGTLNEMTPDEKQLREIFNSIDQDGDGVLDPHDIRVVLRSAGEPEDVISKIAASMDLNQTGKVSWDDFRRVMGAKVGG